MIVSFSDLGCYVHIHGVMDAHPVASAFLQAGDVSVQGFVATYAHTLQKP